MNLLLDPWIPVNRATGVTEDIAPWQITETENPVLRLAAARPDFNGALLQFLIGLLQTACTPENDNDWADWLEQPPTPAQLKEAFNEYAFAFEAGPFGPGNEPRFMQDFDEIQSDLKPISNLLIDAPGAQTLKENKDHFVKRGQIEALCPICATTGLFTLQNNAPSGGAGHRTSLRGGGPLTTVVALDPEGGQLPDDLWRLVWLNVADQSGLNDLLLQSDKRNLSDLFPWLASTRTSEKNTGVETSPADAHALQAFWGMPRRIRLEWPVDNQESAPDGGLTHCDLCYRTTSLPIAHFTTQNYGTNYTGAWQHPLSPHTFKEDGQPLPKHPQPGGITYRHWLGLAMSRAGEQASLPVRLFNSNMRHRRLSNQQLLIHAFGYDLDNAKARCWYQTTFPLFHIPQSIQTTFLITAEKLVVAATESANKTRHSIKEAWFKRPKDAKGDTHFLMEAFLTATESAFFDQLQALAEHLQQIPDDDTPCRRQWHTTLCQASRAQFEHWALSGDLARGDPRRICEARKALNIYLYDAKKGLPRTLGITMEKEAAK